jgi:predicted DNA-binding transcriptional regulator AlpA
MEMEASAHVGGVARATKAARVTPEREFWSIEETIAAYGFSRSFFYKLMDEGGFRTAKVGRRRLVHAPSLRAFVLARAAG